MSDHDDPTPIGQRRWDDQAEKLVLGAVMLDGRVLDRDLADLLPSDFYQPAHAELYRSLVGAHRAGEPTEAAATIARLRTAPIRGVDPAFLIDITGGVHNVATAGWYADRVRDLARIRRVQETAERIITLAAHANLDDVDPVIQQARSLLDQASTSRSLGGIEWFDDLLPQAIDLWDSPADETLATGWEELDDALNGGLRPGHLMVIGARPAIGKSAAATVLVRRVAQTGHAALFASLEMSKWEVIDRITAAAAGVGTSNLTRRQLSDVEWRRITSMTDRKGSWPVAIDDRPAQTLAQIAARARDVSRSPAGLSLVVVDYLQLVQPADRKQPRHEQVASISRGLKLLAKDLGVPIVALAQVNRQSTQRQDARPQMSDLRESGGIEADADEIILLHREEETGEIEFIVAKNRHGRTGRITLEWAGHMSDIRNPHSGPR